MTRTALLDLPPADLARHADAALRAAATRYGFPAVRASMMPRWWQLEVVLNATRRATAGG